MVGSVSVRFENARVEKVPLNTRMQWNAGTACVSECVLKTLACRGLRVGPSKFEMLPDTSVTRARGIARQIACSRSCPHGSEEKKQHKHKHFGPDT